MGNELLAIVRSRVARSRVKLRWRHMIASFHPTTAFGKLHRSSPNLDQGPVRAVPVERPMDLDSNSFRNRQGIFQFDA